MPETVVRGTKLMQTLCPALSAVTAATGPEGSPRGHSGRRSTLVRRRTTSATGPVSGCSTATASDYLEAP